MPAYRWKCLGCETANEAQAQACAYCGLPSRPTTRQIDAARRAHGLEPEPPAETAAPPEPTKPEPITGNGIIVMFFLGVGCLLGAYDALANHHWSDLLEILPWGLGSLDILGMPVGGALLGLIGLAIVATVVDIVRRGDFEK